MRFKEYLNELRKNDLKVGDKVRVSNKVRSKIYKGKEGVVKDVRGYVVTVEFPKEKDPTSSPIPVGGTEFHPDDLDKI